MVDEKEEKEENNDGEECEPPATFFSALESIPSMKKHIMKFGIHDNMMAALSNIKNKV